jgi:DNA-binding GntR family transcriptional regulator
MVGDVVSPHSGASIYQQVAAILRARIAQGTYAPGSELPAEKDLVYEMAVGRDSVRDALALLRDEGLIIKRRGHRTRVSEPMVRTRIELSAKTIVAARMPTPEERVEYDVPAGVPMLTINGVPYPSDRYEAFTP